MANLKKIFVRGSNAQAVLDHLTTRDMGKISQGQAAYVSVLTEQGTMADDAIVSNNGNDEWMIVHGSGDTMALLEASASGKNVEIEFTDELHDVSVQGPQALEMLNVNCDVELASLKYFHHIEARLFGHPCRISRTGYSGERGYEVFADASVVCDIWDKLVDSGVMPCSFTALDKVRIEAGLLFYGYDMTTDHTPWEVGLGFTVSKSKSDFRGKEALMAAKGNEKIINVGLNINHSDMVEGGEVLSFNGKEVGMVNSPAYSHRLGKSLALAHINPSIPEGTTLEVKSNTINTTATVIAMPIYDPSKSKTHA
ncbi:MAG: aminomethyltransferase family protein [Candidatus Thiodiazotropha lotti]|nr:aminomethyltransferase family protein [Candidatus Thiodiazotropha lotti]MCG7932234.1 aminomethyltransferase family protein [Candidatus Thiodiazotropha lotti]MCG8004538.1 aminomethyltransferase family protein [Candidatus Thiodiazotropha lotti]MCG8008906.1 aminomethyltransferase family protein [Candidatus Thiodiazotropha lotti]MCG8021979.1 aminomethyltransferase family protein [Candidatus Thiodiazotropha lotti]